MVCWVVGFWKLGASKCLLSLALCPLQKDLLETQSISTSLFHTRYPCLPCQLKVPFFLSIQVPLDHEACTTTRKDRGRGAAGTFTGITFLRSAQKCISKMPGIALLARKAMAYKKVMCSCAWELENRHIKNLSHLSRLLSFSEGAQVFPDTCSYWHLHWKGECSFNTYHSVWLLIQNGMQRLHYEYALSPLCTSRFIHCNFLFTGNRGSEQGASERGRHMSNTERCTTRHAFSCMRSCFWSSM